MYITQNGEQIGISCDNNQWKQSIGESVFNANRDSPAYVGYQYGTVYKTSSSNGSGWYFAPDVVYENGTYSLVSKNNNNVEIKNGFFGNELLNHHYTCGSTTETTCTSVKYVFYSGNNYGEVEYITLENGKKVSDILDEMLSHSTNTTDSAIKTFIDTWFQNHLTSYTSKIEDTIFCDDRNVFDYGGWNPDGGSIHNNLNYNNYNGDLKCTNITDQFSLSNNSAHLTYPVGLMTASEANLLIYDEFFTNLLSTGQSYWLLSSGGYGQPGSYNSLIDYMGLKNSSTMNYSQPVRPVISLKPGSTFSTGDGSKSNPYVIDWNYNNIAIEGEEEFIELSELENIKEGTEVVFHIIPVDGLISIKIIDEEGNQIEYESTGNENEYKFIMPNSNVTIKPIYKEKLPDIVNPQTGTLLFFALIIVMLLEIGTYQLIKIKKKRMKEFE
jgi:Zn-finger protein